MAKRTIEDAMKFPKGGALTPEDAPDTEKKKKILVEDTNPTGEIRADKPAAK